MHPLRVSAISYLNTAPLMWDFEHGSHIAELREQFEIGYTTPSRCAQMLAEGSADIGIIPVAAYATIPSLRILSDVAIASKNTVRSILLVSNLPIEQIHTVALDTSSRTSAALVQVLFAEHWRQQVEFTQADPHLETMLVHHDAALLIGDPALLVNRSRYLTWDLAEEWRSLTGRAFVFAFWAIREGAASDEDLARAAEVFNASRDEGIRNTALIADEWSRKLPLTQETIRDYLHNNIHYYLDAENIAGMQLFFQLAASHGVLPPIPELRFAPELEFRNSAPGKRI